MTTAPTFENLHQISVLRNQPPSISQFAPHLPRLLHVKKNCGIKDLTKNYLPGKKKNSSARFVFVSYPPSHLYVTCEWVMSHAWMGHVTCMNESCHAWHIKMSHVMCMRESCRTAQSFCALTRSPAACQIWVSHVTHVNRLRHLYEWIMSHMTATHCNTLQHTATHSNQSDEKISKTHMHHSDSICTHTYTNRVVSLIDKSCHTAQRFAPDPPRLRYVTNRWVNSHVWTSHVYMNESCHTCERVMSIWMNHVTRDIHQWASSRVWMSHVT